MELGDDTLFSRATSTCTEGVACGGDGRRWRSACRGKGAVDGDVQGRSCRHAVVPKIGYGKITTSIFRSPEHGNAVGGKMIMAGSILYDGT